MEGFIKITGCFWQSLSFGTSLYQLNVFVYVQSTNKCVKQQKLVKLGEKSKPPRPPADPSTQLDFQNIWNIRGSKKLSQKIYFSEEKVCFKVDIAKTVFVDGMINFGGMSQPRECRGVSEKQHTVIWGSIAIAVCPGMCRSIRYDTQVYRNKTYLKRQTR